MIDFTGSYCGTPPAAGFWWKAWNGDPVLLFVLASAAVAVLRLPSDQRGYGLGAVAMLVVAFMSPLCALTTALFTARSIHHLLLVAGAAPLLALARPAPSCARGGGIATALIVMGAMLWLWHVPPLYDAALGNVALYWAMQVALLGASWWFWSATLASSAPAATVGLTGAAVQMGMLGALLTFAPRPLYATHLATTVAYGIGPLQDQQLAGLVMWVPGMLPFALAAGWISARRWQRAGMAPA